MFRRKADFWWKAFQRWCHCCVHRPDTQQKAPVTAPPPPPPPPPPPEPAGPPEPEEEILGSDDEEQEDPADYCKGQSHAHVCPSPHFCLMELCAGLPGPHRLFSPFLSVFARLPTLFLQSSILMGLAVHVCRHYNSQFRIARLLPKCQRWTEFPATAQEDKGSFTTFKALIITQPRFKMVHHSVKLYFTLISTPQHVSITYHEHHFKWNFSPFFPDGFLHCV